MLECLTFVDDLSGALSRPVVDGAAHGDGLEHVVMEPSPLEISGATADGTIADGTRWITRSTVDVDPWKAGSGLDGLFFFLFSFLEGSNCVCYMFVPFVLRKV